MAMSNAVRVALLGCGTVGTEVVRLLREQADELAARVGARLELAGVAVRRPQRHPELGDLVTTDAAALVARDDVDVVVEVIGGIEPARTLLLEALKAGKSVVTANKALLAEDGAALAEAADASGADLYYEASVAGAIPLLRPLRESLAGDRITRVAGIVNGTTNFILSAMTASGVELRGRAGGGHPAGLRGGRPERGRRRVRRRVQGRDPRVAGLPHPRDQRGRVLRGHPRRQRRGHRGRRRARLRDQAGGDLRADPGRRDAPGERLGAGLPGDDPGRAPAGRRWTGRSTRCSSRPRRPGQLMFYGQGAGGAPTASAVLGDVVAVARNRVIGGRGPRESAHANLPVRPMGTVPTRYHVSLDVADRAGVLAVHRGGVRPARREHRRGAPDRRAWRGRRRRAAGRRHARGAGGGAGRHRARCSAGSTPCAAWTAWSGSRTWAARHRRWARDGRDHAVQEPGPDGPG